MIRSQLPPTSNTRRAPAGTLCSGRARDAILVGGGRPSPVVGCAFHGTGDRIVRMPPLSGSAIGSDSVSFFS